MTDRTRTDDDATAVIALLDSLRAATVARIAEMSIELDGVDAASSGSNVDDEHDPEGATIAFEREQLAAVRAQAQQHLVDIDAAVERARSGTYGYCERCHEPIAAARLDALPAVRLCLSCAAA